MTIDEMKDEILELYVLMKSSEGGYTEDLDRIVNHLAHDCQALEHKLKQLQEQIQFTKTFLSKVKKENEDE